MNKRRLLSLSGLGALLGLARSAEPVRAIDGVPLILGFPSAINSGLEPTVVEGEGSIDVLLKVTAKGGTAADPVHATCGSSLKLSDDDAGTGLAAEGGAVAGVQQVVAGGDGTKVFGGGAKSGRGGTAVFARGGISKTGPGGHGLEAYGGAGSHGGQPNPAGVDATGGLAASGAGAPGGIAGAGIEAFGGPAIVGQPAGAGVIAQGGRELNASSVPSGEGAGVRAEGGFTEDGLLVLALGALGVGGGEPGQGAAGVYGEASDEFSPGARGSGIPTGAGAFGHSVSGSGTAVIGSNLGTGPGGLFQSEIGTGLLGNSTSAVGVEATGGTLGGLLAESTSQPGATGTSTTGVGVATGSINGVGGYFETSNAAQPALWAYNSQAAAGGALGLLVNGDCVVENGVTKPAKPAAVPTSRGLRLLYVVEAATSVFEEVGKAPLRNGRARVELDPLFAETIETRDYQVFLTARGDNRGLYVASIDDRGFEIREQAGGASSIEVNYRIVAQRKGLQPNHRLARIRPPEPPKATEVKRPKPAKLREPKPPLKPPKPDMRERPERRKR